ncbi:MAG: indole-3-glycerol phosphate synthase TrpC [Candidatus Hydrogenedentes bacterium]|nr:indole-3-glycerol phosphate synthase TrpC [Candidatus Hydrogenedentota bacterium]
MILDDICATKREEVVARKATVSLAHLKERVAEVRPADDFRAALRQPGISLIAEVKRASPSKGTFVADLDPVDLAALYEQAGARAISVLTDEKYFKGSLDDLIAVRQDVGIPCLRKDFIIDEYQIYEARAARADALLLITRILSDTQLSDYLALTHDLGMSALVETHNEEEIERALAAGAHIIGINNRDLATFSVDISTTLELKKLVPGGHVLVSESGIRTRDHVQLLEDGGIDAILVGEALVTSPDIVAKVFELLGDGEY